MLKWTLMDHGIDTAGVSYWKASIASDRVAIVIAQYPHEANVNARADGRIIRHVGTFETVDAAKRAVETYAAPLTGR